MTNIVLADDHHVVRQGLRSLLEAEAGFKVVGEVGDGLETIKMVENVHPDILILDLMMAGMNGLEVTREVTRRSPATAVVILSMYGNESYVREALQAGARAYVLKESSSEELVRAVRQALAGRRYLSSSLSEQVIDAYMQRSDSTTLDPYDLLTAREREVLQLAAQGNTNTDIASKLCISPRTVEVHRANMMQKLGLHTQTDLIRYAVQRGILLLDG